MGRGGIPEVGRLSVGVDPIHDCPGAGGASGSPWIMNPGLEHGMHGGVPGPGVRYGDRMVYDGLMSAGILGFEVNFQWV